MLRMLSLFMIACAALTHSQAYPAVNQLMVPSMKLECKLPPKEPQVFINYTYWTVEAQCQILSEMEYNELLAQALAKKGQINGAPLSQTEELQLSIQSGEYLKISAEPGAKVKITNLGSYSVRIVCTA